MVVQGLAVGTGDLVVGLGLLRRSDTQEEAQERKGYFSHGTGITCPTALFVTVLSGAGLSEPLIARMPKGTHPGY